MTIKSLEPETMRECLMKGLAHDDGYHSGYNQAKIDIKEQLNKEYVKGKTDGYSEGYQHGCQITKETTSKLNEQELLDSYNEGYEDGKSRGITLGYDKRDYEKVSSDSQHAAELNLEAYKKDFLAAVEEMTEPCEDSNDTEYDSVNKPKHYNSHPSGIQCIQVTRHYNFPIGNALKYLWRNGLKDTGSSTEDLEKAIWYIQDEIKSIKGEQ